MENTQDAATRVTTISFSTWEDLYYYRIVLSQNTNHFPHLGGNWKFQKINIMRCISRLEGYQRLQITSFHKIMFTTVKNFYCSKSGFRISRHTAAWSLGEPTLHLPFRCFLWNHLTDALQYFRILASGFENRWLLFCGIY